VSLGLPLWDLLLGRALRSRKKQPSIAPAPPSSPRSQAQQDRYDRLVEDMKATWGLQVRKWRSSTSGVAWETHWKDGTVSRMIESPYPRGPMSCAVFLHEVGHHAIGLSGVKPRCLEEKRAWDWSLATMRSLGFNVTKRVLARRDAALRYAVAKALRRGIKRMPEEMLPWCPEGVCAPAELPSC
jgi:hypothetical protein